MSKATDGAFKRGYNAAKQGLPRLAPYNPIKVYYVNGVRFQKKEVNFRLGAINAWYKGYDSYGASTQ